MATRDAALFQLLLAGQPAPISGEATNIASGKYCREQGFLKVLGERQVALNLGD